MQESPGCGTLKLAAWNDATFPMSSSSVDSGAEEDTINGDEAARNIHTATIQSNENGEHPRAGPIVELLQEERRHASTPHQLGNGTNRYKEVQNIDDASDDGSSEVLTRRAESPVDSIPDDSPSVQVDRMTCIAGYY